MKNNHLKIKIVVQISGFFEYAMERRIKPSFICLFLDSVLKRQIKKETDGQRKETVHT